MLSLQASRVPWDNGADPTPFNGLLFKQNITLFLTQIYNCIQLQRLYAGGAAIYISVSCCWA